MADKTFRLEIIAPDRIFYSNDIYMVEYNTVEGQVGVYADHIPMTQIIAPGRLIITERNEEKQAALLICFPGFLRVLLLHRMMLEEKSILRFQSQTPYRTGTNGVFTLLILTSSHYYSNEISVFAKNEH